MSQLAPTLGMSTHKDARVGAFSIALYTQI